MVTKISNPSASNANNCFKLGEEGEGGDTAQNESHDKEAQHPSIAGEARINRRG